MSFGTELEKMDACGSGVDWAGDRSLAEIWRDCERGDWMLWLAARIGVDRKQIVLAACACARLNLSAVPAGEERPRMAIETTERWCRGEATDEEVRAATDAAWAALAAWAATADAVRSVITVEMVEQAWRKE